MPLPSRPAPVPARGGSVFRVLTICSGNLCRSPQAEQLLRKRLPEVFGRADIEALRVESAGTWATHGDPMDRLAQRTVERFGVEDAPLHRTRRVTARMVQEADLVLGMGVEHRDAAVDLDRTARTRAFTLVEFARLVEALDGSSTDDVEPLGEPGFAQYLRGVVAAAADARALAMPLPGSLDIEDPYRKHASVYQRSAEVLRGEVDRLSRALRSLAVA